MVELKSRHPERDIARKRPARGSDGHKSTGRTGRNLCFDLGTRQDREGWLGSPVEVYSSCAREVVPQNLDCLPGLARVRHCDHQWVKPHRETEDCATGK